MDDMIYGTVWYTDTPVLAWYDLEKKVPYTGGILKGEVLKVIGLHGSDPTSQVVKVERTDENGGKAILFMDRQTNQYGQKPGRSFRTVIQLKQPPKDPSNMGSAMICWPCMMFQGNTLEELVQLRPGRRGEVFDYFTMTKGYFNFHFGLSGLQTGWVNEWNTLTEEIGGYQDVLCLLYEKLWSAVPNLDVVPEPEPEPTDFLSVLIKWLKSIPFLKWLGDLLEMIFK